MRWTSEACALAACWLVAACDFAGSIALQPGNRCNSQADCVQGICDLENRLCVSTSTTPLRLGIEIVPATSSGSNATVAHTFPPLVIDAPRTLDWQLPEAISVNGKIRSAADDRVSATLTFENIDAPPFLSVKKTTIPTLGTPQTSPLDGDPTDYAVRLVNRGKHTVTVEPSGEDIKRYPPLRFENVDIPASAEAFRLDIAFPTNFKRFEGRLVRVNSTTGQDEPIDDLIIRAVQATAGVPGENSFRIVSSTATSGSDPTRPGGFALWIDPSVEQYLLQINASADQPLFPTINIDPSFLDPPQNDDPVIIRVPQISGVNIEGQVRTRDGSESRGVSGAVLNLKSSDIFDASTKLSGTFSGRSMTDATGMFSMAVLPGNYELLVTPSSDQQLGIISMFLQVPSVASLPVDALLLPRRFNLTGTINAFDRASGLGGVTIAAAALQPTSPAKNATMMQPDPRRYSRSNETATNFLGYFDLALDDGIYDLSIKPSTESGFPWVVDFERSIGTLSAEQTLDLTLPPPLPLSGVVRDASGAVLVGAEVRAYALIDAGEGSTRAVAIGRAVTTKEGKYLMLIAPKE